MIQREGSRTFAKLNKFKDPRSLMMFFLFLCFEYPGSNYQAPGGLIVATIKPPGA